MKLIRQLTLHLIDLNIAINLLYGEEALNQPSVFHVEVLVDYAINTDLWLGVTAQLQFFLLDGSQLQKTLVITSLSMEDSQKDHKIRLSLILQSPLGLLHYSSRPRVFVNQNKLTVMKHLLIENGIFRSEQCHFHLAKSYPAMPMIIQLYHESNFSFFERLLFEEKLFYWLDGLDIHISDQVLCCPVMPIEYEYNPDDGLIYRFWSEQSKDKTIFKSNSYLPAASPGYRLIIDKESYVVTEVKHYIKQTHAMSDDALPYWNEMTLQRQSEALLVSEKPAIQIPWCFQAIVESPTNSATLDSQGRYQVKFLFDQGGDLDVPHSAFIPRLQCYGDDKQGAQAVGVHFPLYDGTEVLINCIDGDLYQPIILGALATSDHPSIVTGEYPNKNVMTTAAGCGLVLDDQEQRATVFTPSNHLSLDQKKQGLELTAEQGDIESYSKQHTILTHGADVTMQINGQLAISAAQVASVTQLDQDLSLQSAKDFNAIADHDVVMQAATMQLNAADNLAISASTIKQFLQQGRQTWQVKNNLVMKSKKIDIESERLLVLSCLNSAIEMTPDKISFFSKAIEVDAKECRIQANYSNFNDQSCRPFKIATIKPLEDLKILPFINDEQDLTILDCHWSRSEARIDEEIYAHCFVKNIEGHQSGELIVYCDDHTVVARQVFSVETVRDHLSAQHANLQIPWKVSETQQSQYFAYQEKIFYYFDIVIHEIDNQMVSTPLQILIDLNIKVSYQEIACVSDQSTVMVNVPNRKSSLAFVRDNKALARDVLLGKLELSLAVMQADKSYQQQLVYSDQQKQPWLKVQLKLPADLKSQSTTLKSILPAVFVRFDNQADVTVKNALSSSRGLSAGSMGSQVDPANKSWDDGGEKYEILSKSGILQANTVLNLKKSCRSQPTNITLFIHGYDVEPGKLGQCVESVEKEDLWSWIGRKVKLQSDDGLVVNFSDVDVNVYQELNVLKQRFTVIRSHSDFLERYSINGSGDCSWLLAIEHYLNKAAGLDQKGYDYYQRMIGVFWPALPEVAFDYISVTKRIREIGQKTAGLIKQLLNAGFEVNIIAHSLGCGVLMQALNHLAQDTTCQKTVNHCFLWDAAVPNTIFSTRGYDMQQHKATVQLLMESDVWYVPYAKEAAQKFVILHSENDNILGPIPKEQTSGYNQFYINSKKPFLSELVPAVLLTFLGLESVYDIAMVLNVPITHMMDQACFSSVYKQWWARYHPVQDQKGRFYPDSLEKRIRQLSDQEFSNAKNCIWDHYQKNKEIIHRYIDAARKTCTETDITGYHDVEFLVDHPTLVEDYFIFNVSPSDPTTDMSPSPKINPNTSQQNYDFYYGLYVKLPVLISSVFFDNNIHYPKALGYQGVDLTDLNTQQLIRDGKLEQIDQTTCLFSHSGMKNPSRDVFQKIYQQAIWQGRSGFPFGGYTR